MRLADESFNLGDGIPREARVGSEKHSKMASAFSYELMILVNA